MAQRADRESRKVYFVKRTILVTSNYKTTHPMGEKANTSKASNIDASKITHRIHISNQSFQESDFSQPKCEALIEDTREHTEREKKIRNSQLQLQWECEKIAEAGVLFGEPTWTFCHQKCVSLLYLSIGIG